MMCTFACSHGIILPLNQICFVDIDFSCSKLPVPHCDGSFDSLPYNSLWVWANAPHIHTNLTQRVFAPLQTESIGSAMWDITYHTEVTSQADHSHQLYPVMEHSVSRWRIIHAHATNHACHSRRESGRATNRIHHLLPRVICNTQELATMP